jgi:hypothetical protein
MPLIVNKKLNKKCIKLVLLYWVFLWLSPYQSTLYDTWFWNIVVKLPTHISQSQSLFNHSRPINLADLIKILPIKDHCMSLCKQGCTMWEWSYNIVVVSWILYFCKQTQSQVMRCSQVYMSHEKSVNDGEEFIFFEEGWNISSVSRRVQRSGRIRRLN